MKPEIEFMHNVGKDIIAIKAENDKTIGELWDEFFAVMRKYGIKQCTKEGNGMLGDNYEWTMCVDLFISSISNTIHLENWFNIPEDLKCYES